MGGGGGGKKGRGAASVFDISGDETLRRLTSGVQKHDQGMKGEKKNLKEMERGVCVADARGGLITIFWGYHFKRVSTRETEKRE